MSRLGPGDLDTACAKCLDADYYCDPRAGLTSCPTMFCGRCSGSDVLTPGDDGIEL